jgi:lysine 2,3-aminomutase
MGFDVPIARIEQEHAEEAHRLSDAVRTDPPVFEIPFDGQAGLVSCRDHEPIMILADGRRVYRFYPSDPASTGDGVYIDVSIYDYLARLHRDGEKLEQYRSIWYYF